MKTETRIALAVTILTVCAAAGMLSPKGVRDTEAWGISSCGELQMIFIADSDGKVDYYDMETENGPVDAIARLQYLPKEHQHTFFLEKHCPYTYKRSV